jgi:hypothetical protein
MVGSSPHSSTKIVDLPPHYASGDFGIIVDSKPANPQGLGWSDKFVVSEHHLLSMPLKPYSHCSYAAVRVVASMPMATHRKPVLAAHGMQISVSWNTLHPCLLSIAKKQKVAKSIEIPLQVRNILCMLDNKSVPRAVEKSALDHHYCHIGCVFMSLSTLTFCLSLVNPPFKSNKHKHCQTASGASGAMMLACAT